MPGSSDSLILHAVLDAIDGAGIAENTIVLWSSARPADPVEDWDLIENRLDCARVFGPVAERLGALARSAARYPHIEPGEEFAGYS